MQNNNVFACPGGSKKLHHATQTLSRKVVPQNCLSEQGDVKKEKAKDHLKEQQS